MHAGRRKAKYEPVATSSEAQKATTNEDHKGDIEQNIHHNHSMDSNRSEYDKMAQTGLFQVKFGGQKNQDDRKDEEEDVDFQGLGLRKYLERQNIISVERPDFDAKKYGKRSKLDYVKDLAYFQAEIDKLGGRDVIKESERRLIQKRIEDEAKDEAMKKLREDGDSAEDELFVDKPEDSFERRKNNIRNMMCKNNENVLLPPLNGIPNKQNSSTKNVEVVEKRLPRSMQIKEMYYAPQRFQKKYKNKDENEGSGRSTKHSSGDKIQAPLSDDSDAYGLRNNSHSHKHKSGKTINESLTEGTENPSEIDLKRLHQEKPLSFKQYRKALQDKKKKKKKETKQRMEEIVEKKNSSNGSINVSHDSKSEQNSSIRRESTNKLINRITELNAKKYELSKSKEKSKLDIRWLL